MPHRPGSDGAARAAFPNAAISGLPVTRPMRLVPNLPLFLFYRGTLEPGDAYSIAVVGTR